MVPVSNTDHEQVRALRFWDRYGSEPYYTKNTDTDTGIDTDDFRYLYQARLA